MGHGQVLHVQLYVYKHMHTCGGLRSMSGMFLSHPPPYLSVWIYGLCLGVCLSVCVCVYHSTHVRSSENSLRYQSSPSTLLEAGPLCCLDATHIGQLVHWLLVILSSLPISLWESWDCRCLCNVSGFSMDSEELDSGPHTQEASTLTHKPSSLTLPPCYWFSF